MTPLTLTWLHRWYKTTTLRILLTTNFCCPKMWRSQEEFWEVIFPQTAIDHHFENVRAPNGKCHKNIHACMTVVRLLFSHSSPSNFMSCITTTRQRAIDLLVLKSALKLLWRVEIVLVKKKIDPEICLSREAIKKIKGSMYFYFLVGSIRLLSVEKQTKRSIVHGL